MWHEARKQERLIRGMIVDYRRRAERRKDFYEKIKAEPTQFLQLHGRPCKIHLDPAVAAAGEGPAIMMPWQGDSNNMIDRFDVRAHLDYIPEIKYPDISPEDLNTEERQCNYERYRILAQNAFLGISEDKFLQQLAIEEQFGVTIEEKEMQKEKLNEKKGTGVAIGYNYNDPGAQPSSSNGPEIKKVEQKDSDEDSDLEIIDVDLSIDVNKMEPLQAHELNAVGPLYGMAGCDLFSFLTGDADDAEHQKQLLREEKEKAMFSGRKSRRERRAHRDKKLATRVMFPPSYAAPSAQPVRSPSRSVSRTPSPETGENIQFITSFGGEEDEVKPPLPSKPLYADKLKQNLKKAQLYSEVARKPRARSKCTDKRRIPIGPRGPNSRSRSFSRSRSSTSRSRSRSRSRPRAWRRTVSKSRSYSRSVSRSSRSRSRSYSPYRKTRSRSRSRSRNYRSRRSKSPNHSGYRKRNSRSMSYESNETGAPTQPAAPRYYGRKKEDDSSSELSIDSDSSGDNGGKSKSTLGNKSNTNQNQLRLSGSSSKVPSKETLSLKEKLKRKMQAQLSRQLRADKRAEAERVERESRRQARRDEEMRELAIKLRRKQREMRHQQNRRSSDDDSDRSHSESSSRGSQPSEKKRDVRSHTKSPSPQEKRTPVWELTRVSTSTSQHNESAYKDQRKQYEPNMYNDGKKVTDEERPQNYPNRFDKSKEYGRSYDSQSHYDSGIRQDTQSHYDSGTRHDSQSRYDSGTRHDGQSRYDSGTRHESQSRYDSGTRHESQSRYDSGTRHESQNRYDSGTRHESQIRYDSGTRHESQSRYDSGTRHESQSRYDSGTRQDSQSRYDIGTRQDSQSRYDSGSRQDAQSRYDTQSQDRWDSKSFPDRRRPFPNKGSYREGFKNNESYRGVSTSRDNHTDSKEMYNKNKVKLVDY